MPGLTSPRNNQQPDKMKTEIKSAIARSISHNEIVRVNSGITVHSFQQQDKRRTTPMFFANIGTTAISPVLDYTGLNCFLMGYAKAIRSTSNATA